MPSRRRLGRLLLGLAGLVLALPASAFATTTVNAGALSVSAYPSSGLTASRDNHPLFFSSSYSGFFVRFADGPLADRTYGTSSWGRTHTWTPISETGAVRIGSLQTADTVYAARNGTEDVARVQQTVRVVDDARTFRVTYRVQNMTSQPLRYRALTGGELAAGGNYLGYGRAANGPPRFVGAESTVSGVRAGVEEVRSSRLVTDDAAVAVPAWTARRAGRYSTVGSEIKQASGPADSVVENPDDVGVAIAWEDHLGTDAALAPGATARYEAVWHVSILPRLSLTTNGTNRYVGAQSSSTVRLTDDAGNGLGDASIRWTIAGANPRTDPGVATTGPDGAAQVAYTGAKTGTDTITIWADNDADGAYDDGEPRRIATVYWSQPPPQLTLDQSTYDVVRVGKPLAYQAVLRNAIGEPAAGGQLRWTVTGANPTASEQVVAVNGSGLGMITLTATNAGTDVLDVYGDRDADGTHDSDEPRMQKTITWAPPPPPVNLNAWESSVRIGETARFDVNLYDDVGIPVKQGHLLWSVTGVNPRTQAAAQVTSTYTTLSYRGDNYGEDILSVGHDRDGDGQLEAGEPVITRKLSWGQARPAPITNQTLDAQGLNVTVSSVGGLQARFDAETRNVFDDDGYNGFYLRILDGALAGRGYSSVGYEGGPHEPFYGDPQTASTRDGSDLVQRSSWRVRAANKDVLRVHQIARLSDGASSFRLTWRVENLTDTTMRLRAGHLGDISVDGRASGAPVVIATPRRLVGIASDAGIAAGIESVPSSKLPEESSSVPVAAWSADAVDHSWNLADRFRNPNGLGTLTPPDPSSGAAVQWSDHAAAGEGILAGSEARYELVWRLRRALPLRLSPPTDVAETRHEHKVTATLLDDDELPRNGAKLRWTITGAHPQSGSAPTAGLGQVVVAWTGGQAGQDTLTVYADNDDDGVRDADEPQRTATVNWRLETAVDPPTFAPLLAPDGSPVNVNLQTQGADRFLQITPWQAAQFPRCGDGSGAPLVNLGLSVNVNAAAGAIVEGSVSLLSVNPAIGDLLHPIASTLPTSIGLDGQVSFNLQCLHNASLILCYELKEGLLPIERFCVVLGGVGLWDPSGTVYDAAEYDGLVAAGCTPTKARSESAVGGAEVVLHRKHDGAFRRVLSGDPFITPNVNPFVTEADGRYGWNVSAGTYRVEVSRAGYVTATSRQAVVPPPDLELNVGLQPVDAPGEPSAAELVARAAICGTTPPAPPPPPAPAPPPPPAPEPPPAPAPPPPPAPEPPPAPAPPPPPAPEPPPAPAPPPPPAPEPPPAPAPPPPPAPEPPPAPAPPPPPAPEPPPDPPSTGGLLLPPVASERPSVSLADILALLSSKSAAVSPHAQADVRAGKMKVDRNGRLRLRLSCPAGSAPCTGRIMVIALKPSRLAAKKSYSVVGGRTKTVTLRISSKVRRSTRAGAKRQLLVVAEQQNRVFTLGKPRFTG